MVAVPELVLDWNLNRYYPPTADNTPSEDTDGFDIETFPIESIFAPNRPTKGINKAIVGQAVASSTYTSPGDVRFYVGDQDDIYKYWTSPVTTDGTATFPNHTDGLSKARPRVDYPTVLKANKIVIKLETTWATPNAFFVETKTTTGGAYAVRATNPTIDNLGQVILYYNGSSWVSTRPASLVTTDVAGIQLRVNTMKGGTDRLGNPTTYTKKNYTLTGTPGSLTPGTTDGKNSNLNVIAIEAHLEVDMSNRLMTESNQFEIAAESDLYPIGTITSNVGSITLSNNDNVFDEQNAASPYYGLTRQNAEVNLRYIYTIAGTQHAVQQYKMYTGVWGHTDEGSVEIPLADFSKFFSAVKPRAFMWEGKSISEIVWRICDSVGFVDYDITTLTATDFTIPVFWSDGTKTVWELFDELAAASQTAIYFNGQGRLQVRTREAAFQESATPNVHLFGRDVGSTDLANIVSLTPEDDVRANKITVTYRATNWKIGTTGLPALSGVWQPDNDSLVVRSTQLRGDLTNTSNMIWIRQKDSEVWPYKSKVEIDGELIQYEGKQYVYWTGATGTTKNTTIVKSQDDIKAADKLTPVNYRNKNYLSGGLVITERGVWNSNQRDHLVEANNWSTVALSNGFFNNNTRGFKFNRFDSTITIDTPSFMKKADDAYFVYQGSTGQTGYKMYGTRFRFEKGGGGTQRGGLAFQINGSNMLGYYVEVRTTSSIKDQDRKNSNEVMLWARTGPTTWKLIDQGKPIAIKSPRWYDLDVYVNQGTQDKISVFLNGQLVVDANTTGATKQVDSARVGMYARGQTKITFEYFYGIAQAVKEPLDGYGFWDLKNGAMRGNEWELEHVWNKRSNWKKRKKKKSTKNKIPYTGYLFDEFGPYVHEVREFDVKFDPSPVQYSYLYSTNVWEAATVQYVSDAFGAQFVIANVARENAILQGDDSLLFLGNDPVHQVCMVLGRDLISEDDAEITYKNDNAILIDDEVVIELTSDWLQTKEMADAVALWMSKHWSKGVDHLSVEVFGNPLIEVGDIVDIDWPLKNFSTATHKYFVLSVDTQFEGGVKTSLNLRRVNYTDASSLT